MPNAISEVREAMDFCRYYAQEAIKLLDKLQKYIAWAGSIINFALGMSPAG